MMNYLAIWILFSAGLSFAQVTGECRTVWGNQVCVGDSVMGFTWETGVVPVRVQGFTESFRQFSPNDVEAVTQYLGLGGKDYAESEPGVRRQVPSTRIREFAPIIRSGAVPEFESIAFNESFMDVYGNVNKVKFYAPNSREYHVILNGRQPKTLSAGELRFLRSNVPEVQLSSTSDLSFANVPWLSFFTGHQMTGPRMPNSRKRQRFERRMRNKVVVKLQKICQDRYLGRAVKIKDVVIHFSNFKVTDRHATTYVLTANTTWSFTCKAQNTER